MNTSRKKSVLIRDANAHWYAENLEATCPEYTYIPAPDAETAMRHVEDVEIIVGLAPVLTSSLIKAATKLEWVQALTTGVDNLLAMPELDPSVTLTNCGGFHGPQMSELAFMMMLNFNRNFTGMIENQRHKKWKRWPQRLLVEKTVTIVGVGSIAEELAPRCCAFGMRVVGVSDGRDTVEGFSKIVKRKHLIDAASECDFLIVLTPYSAKTHHIINAEVFEAMPKSAVLVNISRGGCIDEAALLDALKNGQIAGAGLDVFANEPLGPSDPLWSAPNTVITPHIGGMSDTYKEQAHPHISENLKIYATDGPTKLRSLIKRT